MRKTVAAGVAAAALVLAACTGRTTSATHVATTSATLNATVQCGDNGDHSGNCVWQWRWGHGNFANHSAIFGPTSGPVNGGNPVNISFNVSGLTASTSYQYEICGRGDGMGPNANDPFGLYCAGSQGTGGDPTLFTTAASGAVTGTNAFAYGTLYGAYDNTPPGSTDIAFPKSDGYPTIHNSAGGTGTFADPLTMATDPRELPIGSKVYDPHLSRYFVMEDSCDECTADFNSGAGKRFDMYVGNPSTTSAVLACEDALTLDTRSQQFIVNPSSNGFVASTPLWNQSTGHCYQPGVDP